MGSEFRVNSYQSNWQRDSSVLALRDGGFVVTWSSYFNNYDDGPELTYVAAQFYDAGGKRVGGEKIMRAVDGSYSGTPQATQLKNGNIALVWSETFEDDIFTNHTHVKAQVFSAKGAALSKVVQVDTVKSFEVVAPEVVALGDGGFTVTFGTDASTSKFDQVYSRSYSASGAARGADKTLNVNSGKFDESVTKSAALTNGNSVVIWNSEAAIDDGTDDGQNQIRATILDEHGKAIRSDFGLTPHFGGAGGAYSDDENYGYAVAARTGGGFAVANLDWTPSEKDGGAKGIYFTAYSSSGKASGKAVTVFDKAIVPGDVEMARLASGHYVVTWDQQSLNRNDVGDDAYAVILSAGGKPLGKMFDIGVDVSKYDDQVDTSVAALAGGGFVVTYSSEAIDSDDEGIAARIYGRGTAGADRLKVDATGIVSGLAGNDRLTGNAGANWLAGDGGNDTLIGGSGNDRLAGGAGADKLYGGDGRKGSGSDTFVFTKLSESTASSKGRDTIYDFRSDDRFDLTAIDANTKKAGNQAFSFIGADTFDGKAGELRYTKGKSDTYVYADTNGDRKSDFAVHLDDAVKLGKSDFLL